MALPDDRWYMSPTLLAQAGIAVGVLSIIATVWVTRQAAAPRRCLYYRMSAVPASSDPRRMSRDAEVCREGEATENRHLVTVVIVSRGRNDILPGDFYDEPLVFDLGAQIEELRNVESVPDDCCPLKVTVAGTELRIGPSMIGGRQVITIVLLADGTNPRLEYRHRPANVELRPGEGRAQRRLEAPMAAPGIGVIGAWLISILVHSESWLLFLVLAFGIAAGFTYAHRDP